MPGLTSRQREMLRLVRIAGYCARMEQARFHSAWIVRERGAVHVFAEPTGAALVRRGLIAPEPNGAVMRGGRLIATRYMPRP